MGAFRMPSLGADMETGTLAEWLVEPGAEVHRGDVIAVVETQKGAIEIEVFEDGVLAETLVEPGTEVPVGTPIATIRGAEEAEAPAPARPEAAPPPSRKESAAPAPAPAPSPPETKAAAPAPAPVPAPSRRATGAGRAKISPAARKRAEELGVDVSGLTGSGPEGAVVVADVERAAGGPAPAAAPAPAAEAPAAEAPAKPRRGLDMDEMRKAIASAMAKSKREIPHYYLQHRVSLAAVRARLDTMNAERSPSERLLPAVLVMKATAVALSRHKVFNGHFVDGAFRPADSVHLGTAVAIRGGGLIAPAIHDADRLDLDTMMVKLKDLVARVRSGGLRSSELTDPTVTLSSLGDRGVEALWGVIYPPQVAIVGAGRPVFRPWAEADALAVREVLTLTLAADHRVSDGHAGALFLAEIGRLLENPEEL